MIRLFLALPLPEDEAGLLWNHWETLRSNSTRIRWVPRDHYHITLLFLGDQETGEIDFLCKVMDSISPLYPPLRLKYGGAMQFPIKGTPRVFAESLTQDPALSGLESLHHLLFSRLRERYSLDSRRFRPHITTARIRGPSHGSPVDLPLSETFSNVEAPLMLTVDRLVLFESVLKPEGAVYTALYSVGLEG